MKKDSTTVTTTSIKVTTTKFFGQCWIQDYICGGTDCAKRLQNLKTRVRNLFSARFRSSESFVQKSVQVLAIARLETKEGNFLFARFTFLSQVFHRPVLRNLFAFHLFSFTKIPSSLNWLGCFGTVSESTFCNKLHLFDENCTPALKTQLLFQKLFKFINQPFWKTFFLHFWNSDSLQKSEMLSERENAFLAEMSSAAAIDL